MTEEIKSLEMRLYEDGCRLAELRAQQEPEPFEDFTLQTAEGPRPLSSFLGPKGRLLVIHNMGESCDYCTLWADVLTACIPWMDEETGWLLVNGDSLKQQASHKAKWGWPYEMALDPDADFTTACGFMTPDGRYPACSAFELIDGQLHRHGGAMFGPHDRFNPVWPLLALFPGAANAYEPRKSGSE
jgi:predicted dithiol-disulfide oxidoreductase (DUF899 family)